MSIESAQPPKTDDLTHLDNFSTETAEDTTPQADESSKGTENIGGLHRFMETKRGKFTAIGAGVLATAGLVFGGVKAMDASNSTHESTPKPTSSSQETSIPTEAKDFVNAYGTRYKDPLATYYSEMGYEQSGSKEPLTIGDDYISSYNFESTVAGDKSPLGFDLLRLSPDTAINVQSSVDQFNNALPTMNHLINLLAKNPTSAEVAVITDEFSKYSGYGNEEDAKKLTAFLNGVVTKYGSASNYTINAASSETTDSSHASVFKPDWAPIVDANSENGGVEAFHNTITLSISVESFDSANKKSSAVDTTENFNFMVQRAPESIDPLHGGFVAIGTR
jgi:hypothetical protein